MITTALGILKYNPFLKQINIRWAKEQCPNYLKQEGCYDVADGSDGRPNAFKKGFRSLVFRFSGSIGIRLKKVEGANKDTEIYLLRLLIAAFWKETTAAWLSIWFVYSMNRRSRLTTLYHSSLQDTSC